MLKWLSKLAGNSNEAELQRFQPVVDAINGLEPEFEHLPDQQLKAKTEEFRARLEDGESLDFLLPEAFALVREAAKRTLGQRHFDVQLMGGMALHAGKIAEMKTGEGKTLVSTLAAYLNALDGGGVHLVTVNDYLARRDCQWMGPIYHMLGLTVSCLQHETAYQFSPGSEGGPFEDLLTIERRDAYATDITYGTNNEFGFDYLRDNMAGDLARTVQGNLNYAIVDEVDNILIDEARTPLIISGQADESTKLYSTFAQLAPRLKRESDYTIDEQHKSVALTPVGYAKVEKSLNIDNLYDPQYYALTHYLDNALKALVFFERDRDYVVRDGEAVIVDEFTGRMMPGRRYSDGLHQAIEAKEKLEIRRESVTLATITLQNYFRLYEKLSGMTGTAVTEAEEFYKIYQLDVVMIPTHKEMVRDDMPDLIFKSEKGKFDALVSDLKELNESGKPVLVGTTSVEKSERLSERLMKKGIRHEVLNAKHHEREAGIVSQAGRIGAVTVATNMAGRGTDIILGGNPEGRDETEWEEEHRKVVEMGGLHIIGTDRHESRRIDNQLRGRAGRQGDPGSSRFYISVEDDLMRRFGGDKIKTVMGWAGMDESTPMEHSWITKSVENAQKKVEGINFDIRKRLVEYDDVANNHRDMIYGQRHRVLEGSDVGAGIWSMVEAEITETIYRYLRDEHGDEWDMEGLLTALERLFRLPPDASPEHLGQMHRDEVVEFFMEHADKQYKSIAEKVGEEGMRSVERYVMLRTIDTHWRDHLTAMENSRQSIGLEAYGQRDPLVSYKRRSHLMFEELTARIRMGIVRTLFHLDIKDRPRTQSPSAPLVGADSNGASQPNGSGAGQANAGGARRARSRDKAKAAVGKVGRNAPCPCGSGLKYKRCHGAG